MRNKEKKLFIKQFTLKNVGDWISLNYFVNLIDHVVVQKLKEHLKKINKQKIL